MLLVAAAMLAPANVPVQASTIPPLLGHGEPHAPILIQSNEDLTLPSLINGVTGGNGTEQDPFRIEDWNIVPATGYGIRISNTTSHVVIERNEIHDGDNVPRFCTLTFLGSPYCVPSQCPGGDVLGSCPLHPTGIQIINSSHVSVEHNDIYANSGGIFVLDSHDVVISNNAIERERSNTTASSTLQRLDDAFELASAASSIGTGQRQFYFYRGLTVNVQVERSWAVSLTENRILGTASFSYIVMTGLRVKDSQVSILNNTFERNFLTLVSENTDVQFHGNEVRSGYLVEILSGTQLDFSQSRLSDVRIMLICGLGTTASIRDSVFSNSTVQTSAFVAECPNPDLRPVIEDNDFLNGSGIVLDSDGIVHNNVVRSAGIPFAQALRAAMLLGPFSSTVEGNTIEDSDVGIASDGSTATIRDNHIHSNRFGVVAYDGAGKPTLRNNSFEDNAQSAVFNTDARLFSPTAPPSNVPVDARENWWGTIEGPDPGSLFGPVLVDPWLLSPPSPG
jgi:parallel beta-helix repeat protein